MHDVIAKNHEHYAQNFEFFKNAYNDVLDENDEDKIDFSDIKEFNHSYFLQLGYSPEDIGENIESLVQQEIALDIDINKYCFFNSLCGKFGLFNRFSKNSVE